MNVRIWKCKAKHDVPKKAGDPTFGSLTAIVSNGFDTAFSLNGNPLALSLDIASSLYQNPVFTQYFKVYSRSKVYTIDPYQVKRFKPLHILKRPIRINGSAGGNADGTYLLATHKMNGVTTFMYILEIWGEMQTDAQTFGSGLNVINTPCVFALQEFFSWELAAISYAPGYYTEGDPDQATVLAVQQGDPSNLNQAAFQGKSSINGALTSGL